MAKRVLVPLDGSQYAAVATEKAIEIAKKKNGTVIGLGIIDKDEIEESAIGAGIGAIYFAEKLEHHKMNAAIQKVKNFLSDFENQCKANNVNYEIYKKSGVPFEMIIELGKTVDLIVTGLRTYFHFETTPEPGETLRKILETSVCPILAVPNTPIKKTGQVLIATDGSVKASKAMRMFAHVSNGNADIKTIYLLNVNDNIEASEKVLNAGKAYLTSHGYNVETHTRVGKPSAEILKFTKEKEIDTVVMGAYGHSDISALFFGRTSLSVIEEGKIPIFFYH